MKRSKSARQLTPATSLKRRPESISSARVGWIVGVSSQGNPLVDFPANRAGPVEAMSAVPAPRSELNAAVHQRRQVVLLFDGGDSRFPILIAFVVPSAMASQAPVLAEVTAPALPEVVEVDGKRVCIEGHDELVLRCGEASITLRRNGKIVLRGACLESRAKGTNRIKGGAVEVN
jgi:hypothetical protein